MTNRGDVVIAQFPYVGGTGSKVRPAVVVQCDRLNQQIENTILAMITGNTSLMGREPTQLLIDPSSPEGASSGLTHASAVKCENLMTVPQKAILKQVGHLSNVLRQKLDACLKAAVELPGTLCFWSAAVCCRLLWHAAVRRKAAMHRRTPKRRRRAGSCFEW